MSNMSEAVAINGAELFSAPLTRQVDSGVWTPEDDREFSYSSDAFAREELLGIVRSARDLSSLSPELEAAASRWPASYYLSARRSSLLRPFDWDQSARVLEVGSGCGSITRFLGETFSEVVAIEGELHRAAVGASRSRDQANVAVACAPFESLQPRKPFDLLFCIGVLEYSPLYNNADDPFLATLSDFRTKIADDGALVVAIENKLGLKYFAGAAEDHTGVRFDGIEGYRRSGGRGPRTMGRVELKDRLLRAGFQRVDFYYPFPDYKLTRAVISESGATFGGSALAEFIAHDVAGDYLSTSTKPLFDQRAVWHELCENGLVGDLANSFLIIASATTKQHHVTAEWDAASYNLTPRLKPFWAETRITGMEDGVPEIERRRLFPGDDASPLVRMPDSTREKWYSAKTVAEAATEEAKCKSSTATDVVERLRPWLRFLTDRVDERGNVAGSLLDAIPQNLILSGDDLHQIDREWEWHDRVPLSYVVSRGLAVFFTKLRDSVGVSGRYRRTPLGILMLAGARQLGLEYGLRDLRDYYERESRLQAEITCVRSSSYRGMIACAIPPQARQVKTLLLAARRLSGKARRIVSRALRS